MSNKSLQTITIVFFGIVNTSYFWEGQLGFWALPVSIILFVTYVVLLIAFLRQIFFLVKEKAKNKLRMRLVIVLFVTLALTWIAPMGFIDFEKLSGGNILVARQEGVANCTVTLKLKKNKRFSITDICFGVSEATGTYTIKNDTVYFEKTSTRDPERVYKYAIIEPYLSIQKEKKYGITLHHNYADTSGYPLVINEYEKNNTLFK